MKKIASREVENAMTASGTITSSDRAHCIVSSPPLSVYTPDKSVTVWISCIVDRSSESIALSPPRIIGFRRSERWADCVAIL